MDTFIEVISTVCPDPDPETCTRKCDCLKTKTKAFKKYVLPILRPNYKGCTVLLKMSQLCLFSNKEARSLRYFKKTLDFFQIYLSNCDNPNGLMCFEFRSSVIRDFLKIATPRGKSEFILAGLVGLLEIIEPTSTHVPDMIELNEHLTLLNLLNM